MKGPDPARGRVAPPALQGGPAFYPPGPSSGQAGLEEMDENAGLDEPASTGPELAHRTGGDRGEVGPGGLGRGAGGAEPLRVGQEPRQELAPPERAPPVERVHGIAGGDGDP